MGPFQFDTQAITGVNSWAKTRTNKNSIELPPCHPATLPPCRVVKHRNRRLMTIANYAATQLSVRRKREEDLRRKREDHLAMVFMGIVVMFCVCHAPRIFLSFYDAIYINR